MEVKEFPAQVGGPITILILNTSGSHLGPLSDKETMCSAK
jgi:hypothetical protein